jgi:hypothetical protein
LKPLRRPPKSRRSPPSKRQILLDEHFTVRLSRNRSASFVLKLCCLAGADSHDFEIVPLAPTLEETVILPLPSPAGNDEDEWEILAHNEERVLS